MFDVLHIRNEYNRMIVPLCGHAGFDRELLVEEPEFLANPDRDRRCWECGSIIGIDIDNEESA